MEEGDEGERVRTVRGRGEKCWGDGAMGGIDALGGCYIV